MQKFKVNELPDVSALPHMIDSFNFQIDCERIPCIHFRVCSATEFVQTCVLLNH